MKIANLPVTQLQALVESLDEDGNGVIDLEEFEIALGSVDTMLYDDEDYVDELEERWGQETFEQLDGKSFGRPNPYESNEKLAPRPPPDQRKSERETQEGKRKTEKNSSKEVNRIRE